jgi:CRP-like cAMP-binding protein
VLIETPRRTVLKLIASIQSVRDQIDQAYLRRTILSRIANPIAPANLDEIVASAQLRTLAPGEVLFREGDQADGLHLVRRGSLMITRKIAGRDVLSGARRREPQEPPGAAGNCQRAGPRSSDNVS